MRPVKENINFIFEVMRMKLEHLYEASNVLDQKISVVAGFLATIMVGLIMFFNNRLEIYLCPPKINLFSFGILLLLVAILFCIFAIATKKYYYPPDADQLYSNKSLNSNIVDLKNQTIADIKESFEHNHRTHELKARLFNISLWLLVAGLIFVFIDFL